MTAWPCPSQARFGYSLSAGGTRVSPVQAGQSSHQYSVTSTGEMPVAPGAPSEQVDNALHNFSHALLGKTAGTPGDPSPFPGFLRIMTKG